MEEKVTEETVTEEIAIPAFDIEQKVFGSGNGEDKISTTVYEIRTLSKYTATLKSISCKASYPDNHPTI